MATGTKPKAAKKTVYVPSRYKQAADKASIQSNTILGSKYGKKASLNESCRREDTILNSKLSKSEEYQGMTSTPTSKGEIHYLSLDASAVTDKEGNMCVPHLKGFLAPTTENIKKNLVRKKKFHNETIRGPIFTSSKGEKLSKEMEAEIDICYAHYLQAVYLESEAKKALSLRTASALESIHKLFNLVLSYSKKANYVQQHQLFLSCLLNINKHCQKQKQIFEPLFDNFPTFRQQYENLANAINASKHKLHVKDAIIPDGDSGEEVFKIILNIKDIITSFIQEFSDVNGTITAVDSLKNYIKAAEEILEALKLSLASVKQYEELVLTEASISIESNS